MMPTLEGWQGFVYAEDRDGSRSLGFKLLAPTNAAWSAEVEALARRLQACPYPETWRPTGLFCSVLLEEGRRLVAVAQYGLRDHTPNQRLGGLELFGAVGPASLDLEQARSLTRWLRERRAATDDPRSLAGPIALEALPPAPELPAVGVLSLRMPATGALLITGTTPDQPDQNLALLSGAASASWQWLPFCGPEFPFDLFSERGPLVAWTPPRVDLAVVLARSGQDTRPVLKQSRGIGAAQVLLVLLTALALNAYAWWSLPERMPLLEVPVPAKTPAKASPPVTPPPTETRERFAKALHRLVVNKAGSEWLKDGPSARNVYERMVATDPDLRCDAETGQALVGLVSQLASFHPERVARIIREEFGDKKGFDPEVIQIVSERVKLRLEREISPAKGSADP